MFVVLHFISVYEIVVMLREHKREKCFLLFQIACKAAKSIVRRLQGDEKPEWSQRKPQSPLGLPFR